MAHKEKGFRFPNDWKEEDVGFHDRYAEMITIPVEVEIKAKNTVFNFHQVKGFLDKAQSFVVQDCYCRTERGNCDSPLNVCLRLDEAAEKKLESPSLNSRQITREEAVKILETGQEAGLVMMAYRAEGEDYPQTICSCCSCCCGQLSGMLRFGFQAHTLQKSHIAVDNPEKCVDCGLCVDKCHFNARKMVEGNMVYDETKCYGCGLCTQTCPVDAISLKRVNN